jgi:broad specificity phosphatase PhoE
MPCPKFIFVRHGQAEHNVAAHGPEGDKAYENPAYKDAPLTPEGVKQAKATGEALADLKILDIWASPLTRTIQTAEEIFEETSAQKLYLHDNLLELLGGGHICNDRKPKSEIKSQFPLWRTEYLPELPPFWKERENQYSMHSRMDMLIYLLAQIYKDSPEDSYVCIVSHWGAIHSFTGKALNNAEYVIHTLEDLKNF